MRRHLIACVMVGLSTGPGATAEQRQQGTVSSDWCQNESWGDERQGFCEVREYTVPAAGATLTVDASPNGAISVEGSARRDIVVRAKVTATAASGDEARGRGPGSMSRRRTAACGWRSRLGTTHTWRPVRSTDR